MVEPENLPGAIIFWLYIVFALVFTFFAIESLIRLPNPAPRKHVATFSVLAIVSFSTLSFNMLHVLVDSYITWSNRQISLLPLSPSSIWQWSITSTLFRDFGQAIVQNSTRFLWTQSALLATMSVNILMGCQGLRHRIPRLWAFFALSQILPISFAQNLFYIALLRSPDTGHQAVGLPRGRTFLVMAAYCLCLVAAPYTAEGPYLMPTILSARLLLLVPCFLPKVKESHASIQRGFLSQKQTQMVVALLAVAMTAKQTVFVVQEGHGLQEILSAVTSHPAVTALGFDLLVTDASFLIWLACMQGYSEPSNSARMKNKIT